MLFPTKGVRRRNSGELPIFQAATAGIYNGGRERYNNYSDGKRSMMVGNNDNDVPIFIKNASLPEITQHHNNEEDDTSIFVESITRVRTRQRPQRSMAHHIILTLIFLYISCYYIIGIQTETSVQQMQRVINVPIELMASAMPRSVTLRLLSEYSGGGWDSDENNDTEEDDNDEENIIRPDFVYEHPYVTSSYYTSTKSVKTLLPIKIRWYVIYVRRQRELLG